jgi:type IV pilus assembly protein PilB
VVVDDVDRALGGQIAELLIRRGLATEEQLHQATTRQRQLGQRFDRAVVELGIVPEGILMQVLADYFGVPQVDLRQVIPDQEALDLLPDAAARQSLAIPLHTSNNHVDFAVADPSPELQRRLSAAVSRDVRLFLAPAEDVRRAIDSHYRVLEDVDRLVQAFAATEAQRQRTSSAAELAEATAAVADDAPVVQVVTLIIAQALRDRASDVHIEPQSESLRVRFRVDGALHDALELPAAIGPGLVSRIKIMAGMNIVERRRPQDGQLTTEIDGKSVDIRVATVATITGEKCVLRILDKTRSLFKLGDLGMSAITHQMYSGMVRAPFGTILCAGPTGSGKTTTLYATLNEINEAHRNVMTIEDPVEYVFPSINQIQTNEQAGITFATGLKSILRQDPDVILVGEIRDVETARIAVQSALTGHLVLSSLHATDSVSALHRFLDMGIESFLIASAVVGIVGQRLVRRICPSCIVAYTPSEEEMAFYEESEGPPKETFYRGEGCNFCAGTGYQDRIGVYELLRITPEIKRLIVGWATIDELRRLAQKQGMRTLRQEGIDLVTRDITTISEIIRSIYAL